MTNGTVLDEMYSNLTPVQHEAALWGDGPLVLLAGPGSGKTRVLTSRIGRLIETSHDATWRILALTFTTRAADEMRSRIAEIVTKGADRLLVGTFHSFAVEVLRQSGSHVGVRTDFKVYSSNADRIKLLKETIAAKQIEFPEPLEKAFHVLDGLRDRLASPEESSRFFQNEERAEYFGNLYRGYSEYLEEQNAIDFPAIIYKCYKLFSDFPIIADKYRRTFRYLNIDEFQDTNFAQYSLLKAFTGDKYNNVFVVADDDQVIYQWNGASPKRLQQFQVDYSAGTMQMPTNFRCPSEVVELANRLVEHNKLRLPEKSPLEAARSYDESNEPVRVLEFDSDVHEAAGIAADIKKRGLVPQGVAVLARTKKVLEGIRSALLEVGIDAKIAQRRDAFASTPYQWLHSSLLLANRRSDNDAFRAFAESSNEVWNLHIDPDELSAIAALGHGDLLRTWVEWVEGQQVEPYHMGVDLPSLFKALAVQGDYVKFCKQVTQIFSTNREELEGEFASFDEDGEAWASLYREIRNVLSSDASLETFLQELEMRSKEPPLRPSTLPLLTIHSAKGNEFDHVYLAGLVEDILPSFQSKKGADEGPQMEEERRNCFVAITRCKMSLTLTHAANYGGWRKQPSRFLLEMRPLSV